MSKYEHDILSTVNLRGTVSVTELAQILDVSDQTIRRIVKPLVELGKVRKVHGALVSTQNVMDPPFLARMNENRSKKVAIANRVAQLITDGGSVMIDTGSTSAFVAQALANRKNLTVITNSAYIASKLAMIEGNRVFMAGTQLRNHDGAAFDRAAFEVIASASVEMSIISASSVHPKRGFLAFDQCEVDIAQAMMEVSARTVMAVDCTKFKETGTKASLRMPPLRAQDIVVCDSRPAERFDDLLNAQEFISADT
ncbi:DeoR/GlpR family DNA-binding transcription regulator [Roseovarius sp. PS-C2]|uniref:DeoR/GlpR family DNA-binding transcription regulator n=1 Tax=Roseovarius sp. PS-C2 TaxID=2820814 RepID=UPI001C0B8599|nr:DeoR/GlpR family DNA-binding transcription regulator [Roseovarius sp. PS-C2]MBU3258742.1 DeoR/GlpR family DNA-binding transcription regulator [Roseovarius sp. PS-C2]